MIIIKNRLEGLKKMKEVIAMELAKNLLEIQ